MRLNSLKRAGRTWLKHPNGFMCFRYPGVCLWRVCLDCWSDLCFIKVGCCRCSTLTQPFSSWAGRPQFLLYSFERAFVRFIPRSLSLVFCKNKVANSEFATIAKAGSRYVNAIGSVGSIHRFCCNAAEPVRSIPFGKRDGRGGSCITLRCRSV